MPFTVNYLGDLSANSGIPATVTSIVAGYYVSKLPTITFTSINLENSGSSAPSNMSHVLFTNSNRNTKSTNLYENRNKSCLLNHCSKSI